jgi:nitroimidazol reductase NimA-like FMN-containing flavoprotein (pyridoxamine 5'-phosphate oxidase superfamily)
MEKQEKRKKFKIRRNTKTKEQMEKGILKFLNEASTRRGKTSKPGCSLKHGLACVLATVKDNVPRATPVDFFNDGLTIWIAGEPGKKIGNIRSNDSVAVGIYHPMDHSKLNRSLQITGKARLINIREHYKEFITKSKKFGMLDVIEKLVKENSGTEKTTKADIKERVTEILNRFNFIKIVPDEITFLYIHPTRGTEKNIWKRRSRT